MLLSIFALAFAVARSPAASGERHGKSAFPEAYRKRWFVAVDGVRWTGDLREIPAGAEVMVTNDQPYHRKIDVGGMKVSVPPGIVEAARQATMRRFPTLFCGMGFVTWPGAYVLKGHGRSMAQRHSAYLKFYGRKTVGVFRKATSPGQVMTYPALILSNR